MVQFKKLQQKIKLQSTQCLILHKVHWPILTYILYNRHRSFDKWVQMNETKTTFPNNAHKYVTHFTEPKCYLSYTVKPVFSGHPWISKYGCLEMWPFSKGVGRDSINTVY